MSQQQGGTMADNRLGGMNTGAMGGHPNRGGYPSPYGNVPSSSTNRASATEKGKKTKKFSTRELAERKHNKKVMVTRQKYALENVEYRRKMEAINSSRGGIDRTIYKLAADTKPKKERDYFYIMRKGMCFLMFLLILVTIAVYALSYVKVEQIPDEYIALFAQTEAVEEIIDTEEGEESEVKQAGEEAENDEKPVEVDATGEYYSVLDPVFGFIKNLSGKLINKEIVLGDSPQYDKMLAKSEVGMTDIVARIALEYFPAALIIYALTALFMMFKTFFGMFGRRIFKKFGLGSIIMIICGGVVALAGLAFTTEPNLKMAYGDIVNILINGVTKKGGFTAGFGLLGLIAIPVLTLIMSMFARKKVPYNIFDN
jgi:hypothetical protein